MCFPSQALAVLLSAEVSGFPWSTLRCRALAAGAAVGAPELERFRAEASSAAAVPRQCRGRMWQGIAVFRATRAEFVVAGF